MPVRSTLQALLTLALLPAGLLHAATITVWEHQTFGGAHRVFETQAPRLGDLEWNDRVSSLRVESGVWEICRDADYWNCRTVGGQAQQASFEALSSSWNDTISSLRPVSDGTDVSTPETLANRLYRALLGREADPEGLGNAAARIRDGELPELVRGIAQSVEYRNSSSRLSDSQILDQIYRGLLDRPPHTSARTAFLEYIERGDAAQVVLDLLGSEEFASPTRATSGAPDAARTEHEIRVQARGTGVAIWGGDRSDTISGAKVVLGGDGTITASFIGSTPHELSGTFTRGADGFFRIDVIDLPDKPPFAVQGGVWLDDGQLARIDVTDGAKETRHRRVLTFIAADYQLPREEARCQQEIGARLEKEAARGEGGRELAFLAPTRVRASSNRYEFRGEVVIRSHNVSALYRCEIDPRSGQVHSASVDRR